MLLSQRFFSEIFLKIFVFYLKEKVVLIIEQDEHWRGETLHTEHVIVNISIHQFQPTVWKTTTFYNIDNSVLYLKYFSIPVLKLLFCSVFLSIFRSPRLKILAKCPLKQDLTRWRSQLENYYWHSLVCYGLTVQIMDDGYWQLRSYFVAFQTTDKRTLIYSK